MFGAMLSSTDSSYICKKLFCDVLNICTLSWREERYSNMYLLWVSFSTCFLNVVRGVECVPESKLHQGAILMWIQIDYTILKFFIYIKNKYSLFWISPLHIYILWWCFLVDLPLKAFNPNFYFCNFYHKTYEVCIPHPVENDSKKETLHLPTTVT
jgi:hypothetical protein